MRINLVWIIVLVVAVCGILSCCGIAILLLLSSVMADRRDTTPPFNKSSVVSADDLASIVAFPGRRSKCESTRVSKYSDGEIRYLYKYESDKDPEAPRIFSLESTTNICVVPQAAVRVFETELSDARLFASLAKNVTLCRRDDLLDLGDERFVAFFVNEFGEANAMAVAVRSGATVVAFVMVGNVIEDPAVLRSVLASKLPLKSL